LSTKEDRERNLQKKSISADLYNELKNCPMVVSRVVSSVISLKNV